MIFFSGVRILLNTFLRGYNSENWLIEPKYKWDIGWLVTLAFFALIYDEQIVFSDIIQVLGRELLTLPADVEKTVLTVFQEFFQEIGIDIFMRKSAVIALPATVLDVVKFARIPFGIVGVGASCAFAARVREEELTYFLIMEGGYFGDIWHEAMAEGAMGALVAGTSVVEIALLLLESGGNHSMGLLIAPLLFFNWLPALLK